MKKNLKNNKRNISIWNGVYVEKFVTIDEIKVQS